MDKQKYLGCWYCDNMIDHPDQVGLLHLGFPRCFVLMPNLESLMFTDYDTWKETSKVMWLDPSDKYSEKEKENVLVLLWNFSVEQERYEEEYYEENKDEIEDIFE